jgi:hypothetical protein
MSGNSNAHPAPLDVQLRDLERLVQQTHDAYHAILAERRRPIQEGLGVADELTAYYADVTYRRRDRDRDEETRLTAAVLQEVVTSGYRLVPLNLRNPDAGLKVVSDEPDLRLQAAQAAAQAARSNVEQFQRVNASKLAELANEQQMRDFRAAYEGDDPSTLGAALAALPKPDERPTALRTEDVPTDVAA